MRMTTLVVVPQVREDGDSEGVPVLLGKMQCLMALGDFPSGPVVKTPRFQGARFRSLLGELRSCVPLGAAKRKGN